MTDLLLQFGVSNLCISLPLAMVAWAVHAWGKRPTIAHLLWVLVLLKLVTPPIVTIPVVPAVGLDAPIASTLAGDLDSWAAGAVPALADSAGGALDRGAGETALARIRSTLVEHGPSWLLALWLLGSAVILFWSVARVYRFNRLLAMASRPAPPEVQEVAAGVARRLGLESAPTIETATARFSPMVWWLGGPVRIVIPETLVRDMATGQLRWILAHELAHVRRRDHLVRWLEWLACVGFWWNPVAWWARRNLRISEEICCDALVLASFEPRPTSYANALMTVVEFLAAPVIRPPAVASEMSSGGSLEKRFNMIVSNTAIPTTQRWLRASILVGAVAVLPLGLAAVDAAAPEGGPAVDTSLEVAEDALLNVLGELVASGAMDGSLAYELFAASMEPAKLELLAGGETTEEDFEHHVQLALRSAIGEAKLKQAVATGEMSEEEAWHHLHEMHRAHDDHKQWFAIKRRVEAAVESGEMTREEANASYAAHEAELEAAKRGRVDLHGRLVAAMLDNGISREQIEGVKGTLRPIVGEISREGDAFELDPQVRQQLDEMGLTGKQIDFLVGLAQRLASRPAAAAKHDRGDEDIRRHIAEALLESGLSREQVEDVMGSIRPIVAEMKREGDAFKLDPNMRERLDVMGLTQRQIEVVMRIAQHLASDRARHDRERAKWEKIRMEIEGAVKRGEMTREEADAKYEVIKSKRHTDAFDWAGLKHRVEGAVKSGEMTREEADEIYRGIEERMAAPDRR